MFSLSHPSALCLRSVKLLEGVPETRLARLASECTWRNFAAGQYIIGHHDADLGVSLIVSGSVRIMAHSRSGRQVIYVDRSAGEFFGECEAFDGQGRIADVLALEPVLLASASRAVCRRWMAEEAGVVDRVVQRLVSDVRRLSEQVMELSTAGVVARVHTELLRIARKSGVVLNASRIDPAPRHADIAAAVGTYREEVSREMSRLSRLGVVRRDLGAIVVPDVTVLENLVLNEHALV